MTMKISPEVERIVSAAGLQLGKNEKGLVLEGNGQLLQADLEKMLPRLRQANLEREMLVKASRVKGVEGTPVAVDATAGFAEDSLLLAAAGFRVILFERDPVIALLLCDALERAKSHEILGPIVERMELHQEDSIEGIKKLKIVPDIILLDPMFPQRQKSALIKKKFQLLQQLEKPCEEEAELLDAAIQAGPRKVVIKRPLKGPYLAGKKPSHSMEGKAIRYDCIVLPR